MRSLIHAVLLFAVALCGLHVAEPVQAHSEAAHHDTVELSNSSEASHAHEGSEQGTADAAHANAHHCPLTADPRPSSSSPVEPQVAKPVGYPVKTLASLGTAPLEEPPLN